MPKKKKTLFNDSIEKLSSSMPGKCNVSLYLIPPKALQAQSRLVLLKEDYFTSRTIFRMFLIMLKVHCQGKTKLCFHLCYFD